MGSARAEPAYAARSRLRRQLERLGGDARTARVAEGLSQAAVAARARVSQSSVARLEAGDIRLSVVIVASVFSALGMDLSLKAYPGRGVRLRDSGQIALTEAIRAAAHSIWRIHLEAPVGDPNGQAADVLLLGRSFGIHIEVESALVDLQAQLRKGQLKRDRLEQRLALKLAFVLALGESKRNRQAVQAAGDVVHAVLPASTREVMTSLRGGLPLHHDGLLWVRPAPETGRPRPASQTAPTGD